MPGDPAQGQGQKRRFETLKRPKVICLCGSTRFIDQFATATWELERGEGAIVLGCTLLPIWYCGVASHFGEATGTKEECDEHHRRKIDLADEVLVLNIGGYIGESTRGEIEYAHATGKPVRYVTDEPALLLRIIPSDEQRLLLTEGAEREITFYARCQELGATDTDIVKHALEDQARLKDVGIENYQLKSTTATALARVREVEQQVEQLVGDIHAISADYSNERLMNQDVRALKDTAEAQVIELEAAERTLDETLGIWIDRTTAAEAALARAERDRDNWKFLAAAIHGEEVVERLARAEQERDGANMVARQMQERLGNIQEAAEETRRSLLALVTNMRTWAGPESEWDQNDMTPREILAWADRLASLLLVVEGRDEAHLPVDGKEGSSIFITVTPPGTTKDQDDWQVWAALTDADPILQNESFVIGRGATSAEAGQMAVATLEQAIRVVRASTPPVVEVAGADHKT